jgi:hypothetical protein
MPGGEELCPGVGDLGVKLARGLAERLGGLVVVTMDGQRAEYLPDVRRQGVPHLG